jgi:hypothetical protein
MTFALFGIENDGLNLAVNLLMFFLVVIWLALVYWTYQDAQRRIEDPMLVGSATAASLFPFIGTIVYTIVRPPEYLDDARERELEIHAAQTRMLLLESRTCRNCGQPIEASFLRCPSCKRKLRDPCRACGKPLDPRWRVCPYCEVEVQEQEPAPTPRARSPRAGERTPAERAADVQARRGRGGEGRPEPESAAGRESEKSTAPPTRETRWTVP